jgi:uncharacterized RDD family membrane protein YckC
MLTYALVMFFYFVGFELVWGATLGKRLLGLRVISADGGPISFGQAFGRNFLRIVDAFPYIIPDVLGLVVVGCSRHNRRVGDMVAKTLVVRR